MRGKIDFFHSKCEKGIRFSFTFEDKALCAKGFDENLLTDWNVNIFFLLHLWGFDIPLVSWFTNVFLSNVNLTKEEGQ